MKNISKKKFKRTLPLVLAAVLALCMIVAPVSAGVGCSICVDNGCPYFKSCNVVMCSAGLSCGTYCGCGTPVQFGYMTYSSDPAANPAIGVFRMDIAKKINWYGVVHESLADEILRGVGVNSVIGPESYNRTTVHVYWGELAFTHANLSAPSATERDVSKMPAGYGLIDVQDLNESKGFSVIFNAPIGNLMSLGYAPVDIIFEYYDSETGEWLPLNATLIGAHPDYTFKVDVPAGMNGVLIRSGISVANGYTNYPENLAESLAGVPVGRVPYEFSSLI